MVNWLTIGTGEHSFFADGIFIVSARSARYYAIEFVCACVR
jgi:hypothetical protein